MQFNTDDRFKSNNSVIKRKNMFSILFILCSPFSRIGFELGNTQHIKTTQIAHMVNHRQQLFTGVLLNKTRNITMQYALRIEGDNNCTLIVHLGDIQEILFVYTSFYDQYPKYVH